jgi:hypothetical protein
VRRVFQPESDEIRSSVGYKHTLHDLAFLNRDRKRFDAWGELRLLLRESGALALSLAECFFAMFNRFVERFFKLIDRVLQNFVLSAMPVVCDVCACVCVCGGGGGLKNEKEHTYVCPAEWMSTFKPPVRRYHSESFQNKKRERERVVIIVLLRKRYALVVEQVLCYAHQLKSPDVGCVILALHRKTLQFPLEHVHDGTQLHH